MQSIEVTIREKDKGGKRLSFLNLKEEVVNFLYRDTVANSTKADMQFFVLVYFASIHNEKTSYLERIFDEGLPKFDDLIQDFKNRTGYLKAREYRALVEKHGLTELFENDIFFVLSEALLNLDNIETKFDAFYQDNDDIKTVLHRAKGKYRKHLRDSYKYFTSSKIQDDRYDDEGNYHDLSKSVYRTIRMRISRNLDLNLQKYTEVKEITSQSPLIVEFIQYVDPQIVIDLWEKYHLTTYMASALREFKESPIATTTALASLVLTYRTWKNTNGRENPKAKRKAKAEFQITKAQTTPVLNDLIIRLVDSVLKSNETLNDEVKRLRKRVTTLQDRAVASDKDEIKRLKARLESLENLEVSADLNKENDEGRN